MIYALRLILQLCFKGISTFCNSPDILREIAASLFAYQATLCAFFEKAQSLCLGEDSHVVAKSFLRCWLCRGIEVKIAWVMFMSGVPSILHEFGESSELGGGTAFSYAALVIKRLTTSI